MKLHRLVFAGIASLLLAACAAPGPKIRTDYDKASDFSIYRTFGFPAETGTDRGGYSTLLTSYFKDAVTREMELRGYKYSETNPDLLVNFFTTTREKSEVRSDPTTSMSMGYGYYGYRYGLYTAWPMYRQDVETIYYTIGTANVDIVDANRKQLIWEGVAEGRLTEEAMANPKVVVNAVVMELFRQFPGKSSM